MSEGDLITHQSVLQDAIHATRENVDMPSTRRSTRAGSRPMEVTNAQTSSAVGSQRPSVSLVSGTRAERSIITRRNRELLLGIKADAERWTERALSPSSGAFTLREGRSALESLTSAFNDIRGDTSVLELLRNEVVDILDTFEVVLGQLQSNTERPEETSPIIFNSGMCRKNLLPFTYPTFSRIAHKQAFRGVE